VRLRDIEINSDDNKLEMEFEGDQPFCVVYCGGKAKYAELPPHGETSLITHQGKVKRVKFDEGEEF